MIIKKKRRGKIKMEWKWKKHKTEPAPAAPVSADDFLDKLVQANQSNVAKGRERFGTPEGFDDSNASYQQTEVHELYTTPNKATVVGKLECRGFNRDETKIRDLKLYVGTPFIGGTKYVGGFSAETNYEKTLIQLMGQKYELTDMKGHSSGGGLNDKTETNTLRFAYKDDRHKDGADGAFWIEMQNSYMQNNDSSRGEICTQEVRLSNSNDWVSLADAKYAVNAVYKAVGLTK